MYIHKYLAVVLYLLSFCFNGEKVNAQDVLVNQLADWLSGSFNSKEQSMKDSSYYHIHLEIVRIWPERHDGVWLYVEQAMAENMEKPYRQRVYRVTQSDKNTFESAIYTFKDPVRFAGHPEMINKLPLDSIYKKEGCSVFLTWNIEENSFVGSTGVKTCPSDLRGASYATSEVKLKENMLLSWDRGFDEAGNQVWGAEKGGYIFLKQKK